MNTHSIIYSNPERAEHVRGVAMPVFIHNGNYHLSELAVYEDGVADCWELVAIDDLHKKIGWISSQPPEGASLSIHSLGVVTAVNAEWLFPTTTIIQTAQDIFHKLNPQQNNLLDLVARRTKIASEENLPEERIWQTRLGTLTNIYRLSVDGQDIYGDEVPLFQVQGDEFQLKSCFVYQDRQTQLGYSAESLPVESIREMLDRGVLVTSIPDGAYLTVPGLGRFKAMDTMWFTEPQERWREILNLIAVLNGEPDAIEVCYQAFLKYQSEPTEANRALLRTAYEAVPEHQRIYTQRSMDNKDHNIRSILRSTS
jgi:hypothetical protein